MMPGNPRNSDDIPGCPGNEGVRATEGRNGLAACPGRIRVHTLCDEHRKLRGRGEWLVSHEYRQKPGRPGRKIVAEEEARALTIFKYHDAL